MPREAPRSAVSEEVQRMLQEALEGEDQRLVALERRLGQLRAERWRPDGREPAGVGADARHNDLELGPPLLPPQPPPPAPAPPEEPLDLDEARRLVAESGRYLRELERSIQAMEGAAPDAEPDEPPDFSRVQPIPASVRGGDRHLHDPARHELGRVFGAQGPQEAEPAWAQALVAAQERTLAAVERLGEVLARVVPTPDDRRAEELVQPGWQLAQRVEELERRLPEPAPRVSARDPEVPSSRAAPRSGVSARLRAHLSSAAPRPLDPARAALAQALAGTPPLAAPPPRREPAREELIHLAGEHQALVMGQVRLLERLIALLESDPG